MSALGNYWRIQVKNATAATSSATASTVKGKRWKPGTSGEADYEASEQTFFSGGSIAAGGYGTGSAFDNDSSAGYYGMAGLITIVNGTAAGNYEVRIQQSSDSGTTWPDDGGGELIATVYAGVSSTAKDSINL